MMIVFSNRSIKILVYTAIQLSLVPANQEISNCGSETHFKECQFEENIHTPSLLKCQQIKGNIFGNEIVPITKCPGPGKDLNLSLIRDTNYLLIDWRLPHDSSIYHLEGFLLKVTFTFEGRPMVLLRSFKITIDHDDFQDDHIISQIIIKYACIGVFPQTYYHARLISYPISSHPSIKESVIYVPRFNFSVTPEETLSGEWKARMWTTIRRENNHFLLTVCFFGAPAKFSMRLYYLFLLMYDDKRFVGDRKISVDDEVKMDGKRLCGTFENLAENIYIVELLPFGPDECRCEYNLYDDDEPICVDSCSKTVIGPIDLKVPEPDHSAVGNVLLLVLLCFALMVVVAIVIVLFKFAKKKIKKNILKDRKGKVLLVILDCVNDNFSTSVKEYLEKNLFTISECDLTIEGDDDDLDISTSTWVQIQGSHSRYLIVHQKNDECDHLGEPDMEKDKTLERFVSKFLRKEFKKYEICVHPLQLRSGCDPRISLKRMLYTYKQPCSFVQPGPVTEMDDDQIREILKNINSHVTFVDSGFSSET